VNSVQLLPPLLRDGRRPLADFFDRRHCPSLFVRDVAASRAECALFVWLFPLFLVCIFRVCFLSRKALFENIVPLGISPLLNSYLHFSLFNPEVILLNLKLKSHVFESLTPVCFLSLGFAFPFRCLQSLGKRILKTL